jgi:FMN phosphatase YigB (HAD superfamily)
MPSCNGRRYTNRATIIITPQIIIFGIIMIKLIIFDVGGVIDRFDESMYIEYISKKLHISPVEFRNALIPTLDRMEVGTGTLVEMEKTLSKRFNVSRARLEWGPAFEKLNGVNWDVVKLINGLSKHYRIAILTNISRSRHLTKMHHDYAESQIRKAICLMLSGNGKARP